MPTITKSEPVRWLEHALSVAGRPTTLDDDQARCVEVLTSIARIYNLVVPGGNVADAVSFHPKGLSIVLACDLASYDGAELTSLVLAAHEHHVRVALSPWRAHLDETRAARIRAHLRADLADHGFDGSDLDSFDADPLAVDAMVLHLHARTPDGDRLFERHPGLEALAATATRRAEQRTNIDT